MSRFWSARHLLRQAAGEVGLGDVEILRGDGLAVDGRRRLRASWARRARGEGEECDAAELAAKRARRVEGMVVSLPLVSKRAWRGAGEPDRAGHWPGGASIDNPRPQ